MLTYNQALYLILLSSSQAPLPLLRFLQDNNGFDLQDNDGNELLDNG